MRVGEAAAGPLPAEPIELTDEEFKALPEYSSSLPTGVFVGKRWKRNVKAWTSEPPVWFVGEYTEHPTDPSLVRILWRRVLRPGEGRGEMASVAESLSLIDGEVE